MSFELFIALRYLFSKRQQAFISVISGMSVLGVAIGVGALVVVMGVYNGFTEDIRNKIFLFRALFLKCWMSMKTGVEGIAVLWRI